MASILYPPTRPQWVGEVLDSAFRIFRATLLRCLPYSVLATVAGQIQNVYLIATGQALHKFGSTDPLWWVLYASGIFLGCAFINAIILRQAAIASGAPSRGSAALREGLRKAPAAIAMIVILVTLIGLCFLPLLGVPRAYWSWTLVALTAPVGYVMVLCLCSWPALLVGHKGILGSLRYSAHLVRGNWWRTMMIYLVALIMIIVLSFTAGLIVGVLAQFAAARDLAVTTAVSAVMVVASGAIYMPFATSMSLALYGDLQARKEGSDLERRIAGASAG